MRKIPKEVEPEDVLDILIENRGMVMHLLAHRFHIYDYDDREDILQDAMLAIHTWPPKSRILYFMAWLRMILGQHVQSFLTKQNKIHDIKDAARVARGVDPVYDGESFLYSSMAEKDFLAMVDREWRREEQRQAFRLLFLEEVPVAEVARGLGRSRDAISAWRDQFSKYLEEKAYEENLR